MDVRDATHDVYGEVLHVAANPVVNRNGLMYFTPYLYEETMHFFAPLNDGMIDSFVEMTRTGELWDVPMDIYDLEYCNFDGKPHTPIYIHKYVIEWRRPLERH